MWRAARKISKAVFWLVTPWRMRERLLFLHERTVRNERVKALAALLDKERLRQESLRRGASGAASPPVLDLFDTVDVLEAAQLPPEQVFWAPVHADAVTNREAAARFLLDALRQREELRDRFPGALSEPGGGGLVPWLQSPEGQQSLGVTPEDAQHLVSLFSEDFAARARQFFLVSEEIRRVLPHGLLPSGQRSLFRWFLQHGLQASDLGLEEVWWLFLQARENPRAELRLAFLFTPHWQQNFPDALTVFGWSRFADWVDKTYGAGSVSQRLAVSSDFLEPALQIRIAYLARTSWRDEHPDALSNTKAALGLLQWLESSEDAQIGPEARAWVAGLNGRALIPDLLKPTVNVIGHFCYPSGLRVSVEAMTEAMASAGVRTCLRDIRTDARDDPQHVRFDGLEAGDITIIHAQPEPFFSEAYARADLVERMPRTYRIAYWYWEFDSIPDAWTAHAAQADEVWTATEFIARGLRERLSVPVKTLFPGVTLAPFQIRDRAYFNLDADRFTFLFTFHMMSVMERKNPLGLVRAFKMAFRADEPVALVLKTSFGDRHPEQFRALSEAVAGFPSITIIDQVLSSDEVLSLMHTCDAYVSLHRSEGLGLTMAEAMLMGKPVIATGFSGNMDFMDEENSLLVSYERVKVGRPIPPYDAELEWAEPSVEHAAQLLRQLYAEPEWAREVGARGKLSAQKKLSLESAGQRIAARLNEISVLRRSAPAPDLP
ncbi:glycosyltransferase involved in cell wall biosynthesis [Variovorax boronicumulans]|uniref:glycosyltransferase family 4 protein n=1 Tax=Variovorax boronicumulans TaxID=436515 RepID=UPI0027826E5C|nr:glycosyltransferase family 4 protein [Variovorax boronicumulans]MDP9994301.1 glycosyltransferase involved in cell wall biosynthesis [Variovorax boronicumulans]MDQ0005402.1 glycosyltransferase involved in cell wall biosynthesis [Variovorax boronicumulans]